MDIKRAMRTNLDEDQESFEKGGGFEHEAGVLSEPFDVAFVARVDEDGGVTGGAAPVCLVDEVALLEGVVARWIVVEVIKDLCEESLLVEFGFGVCLQFDC